MATIIGQTSGTGSDVITASQAQKVAPYRDDNVPIVPVYTGIYTARLEIIPTTLTLGTAYFSMRNIGALKCHISSLRLAQAAVTRCNISNWNIADACIQRHHPAERGQHRPYAVGRGIRQ